jgi:hypothetical protein
LRSCARCVVMLAGASARSRDRRSYDAELVAFGVDHDHVVQYAIMVVKPVDGGAGGDESVDGVLDPASPQLGRLVTATADLDVDVKPFLGLLRLRYPEEGQESVRSPPDRSDRPRHPTPGGALPARSATLPSWPSPPAGQARRSRAPGPRTPRAPASSHSRRSDPRPSTCRGSCQRTIQPSP